MGQDFPFDQIINHIYFHIPFCLRKCSYCSFYSVEDFTQSQVDEYVNKLRKELRRYKDFFQILPVTIYFGGGTPSVLSAEQIDTLLKEFDQSLLQEVTLELNPLTTPGKDQLKKICSSGVNRVSIGVQSFLDSELKILGRLHKSKHIYKTYELLIDVGLSNISLDLIYGLPFQKIEDLKFSVKEILSLRPQHISTYCLSLDQSVRLYQKRNFIPSEEALSDYYHYIRKSFVQSGYEHYELSSYSLNNMHSRHNLAYWRYKNYLGFGASAAGFVNGIRYRNYDSFEKYFDSLNKESIMPDKEILDSETKEKEFIFLSLRTTRGLSRKMFRGLFQKDFVEKYQKKLSYLFTSKYLKFDDDYVKLTPQAYFVSDEIFSMFC